MIPEAAQDEMMREWDTEYAELGKIPPRVTKITVAHGRTVNLGNYESMRVDITIEAETDDELSDIKRLFRVAEKELRAEIGRVLAL